MAIEVLRNMTRGGVSAFAGAAAWFGATAPDPAEYTDWFLPTGEHFKWDGAAWFQPPGVPGQSGAPAGKKTYLWG